jgi:hypothetical protein
MKNAWFSTLSCRAGSHAEARNCEIHFGLGNGPLAFRLLGLFE